MTKIAAVQTNSVSDVTENLDVTRRLIEQAVDDGAEIIVLPENFSSMPGSNSERLAAAECENNGVVQDFLSTQAGQHQVWIVGGTIAVKSQQDPNKVRSACFVFDNKGRCKARYDKMHLFNVDLGNGETYREADYIEPGEALATVSTPHGCIGLSVCYDVRFPELFRALNLRGAEILTVPSAFAVPTGCAHWEVLLRARAVENLSYVVAPAQWGRHPNGRETFGHSMIIDPWGEILACQKSESGVIVTDINLPALRDLRKRFPALKHRRIRSD